MRFVDISLEFENFWISMRKIEYRSGRAQFVSAHDNAAANCSTDQPTSESASQRTWTKPYFLMRLTSSSEMIMRHALPHRMPGMEQQKNKFTKIFGNLIRIHPR